MITEACPRLTHFQCAIERSASQPAVLQTVYETIVENLPHLEHLRVVVDMGALVDHQEGSYFQHVKRSRDNIQHNHHHALEDALHLHHNQKLETFQVDLFRSLGGELEVQFHFVKDNSEGKLVVAQKMDRPDFGMDALVSLDV
ncbi:hypothetical protein BT96DRAFT_357565 [Gymnopus androsaceus JB14]|uniref:Uncharacterized protein n=1 Tax=Gymnopus androsaceus JB14 TaxID=1447944 RepID=A0A6A4I7Q2_9AGAR|nr:hypothetical protein BT96DRAFT_357565 [Gymnopus androsaceus JB14]